MRKLVSVVSRGSYFFAFCDDGTTWYACCAIEGDGIVWKQLGGILPLSNPPPQTPPKEPSKGSRDALVWKQLSRVMSAFDAKL